MRERSLTILETAERLGVCRSTIVNLLRSGKLKRATSLKKQSRGRPITMVSVNSVVEYIQKKGGVL